MEGSAAAGRLTRLQLGGAAVFLAACAAVWTATCRAPDTVYLEQPGPGGEAARWIQAPFPVRRQPWTVSPDAVPTATFERRFELGAPLRGAVLEIAAWRAATVELDGEPVGPGGSLELHGRERALALPDLAPGPHRLRIEVRNPTGPPLLRASLGGGGAPPALATGPGWEVALPGGARPARVADDTRPPSAGAELPGPREGLGARATWLACAFAAGAGGWLLAARAGAAPSATLVRVALGVLGAAWLAIFARALGRVPVWAGPDAIRHAEYVRWLAERASLPRPDEAWAAYQPPLFYLLAAVPHALLDPTPGGVAERIVLRAVPALAAFGSLAVCAWMARRVLRDGQRGALLALAFAAAVPANLLQAVYVSNEALHALLANGALLAAVALLLDGRYTARRLVAVGLLAGAAVLAKVTALLLVPVVAFFAGLGPSAVEGRRLRTGLAAGVVVGGVALAVCGGFFLRNHALYGQWLLWNHAIPGAEAFWQEPGFRTAAYYLGFGEVLRHPYAASFHSLGDAVYATFWGDGDTAGITRTARWRVLWDVPSLSAAYALALPATLLAVLGYGLLLRDALRDPDPRRRAALTLVCAAPAVVAFALAQRSLALPYYSFVKGSFALGVLAPLAVAAARGLGAADALLARLPSPLPRAFLYGWLAALLAAVYRGAWG